MKVTVLLMLILFGFAGMISSVVMIWFAFRFSELGRVMFYLMLFVFSAEVFGVALAKFLRFQKEKQDFLDKKREVC